MQQWLRSTSSRMPTDHVRGAVVQVDADDGGLNDGFFARSCGGREWPQRAHKRHGSISEEVIQFAGTSA